MKPRIVWNRIARLWVCFLDGRVGHGATPARAFQDYQHGGAFS